MKYAKGKGFLILEVGNVGTFYNNLFFILVLLLLFHYDIHYHYY